MAKEKLTKEKLKVRLHKLKIALYEGAYKNHNGDWHEGAHEMLTKVLNTLDEYQDYH